MRVNTFLSNKSNTIMYKHIHITSYTPRYYFYTYGINIKSFHRRDRKKEWERERERGGERVSRVRIAYEHNIDKDSARATNRCVGGSDSLRAGRLHSACTRWWEVHRYGNFISLLEKYIDKNRDPYTSVYTHVHADKYAFCVRELIAYTHLSAAYECVYPYIFILRVRHTTYFVLLIFYFYFLFGD